MVDTNTESWSSDCEDGAEVWKEQRREPLGAAEDAPLEDESCASSRLHALEDEQETLSSSLFSLTSHLAQVQFRLRQIVEAPSHEKEAMLRSLEEFTSGGVPDLGCVLGPPGLCRLRSVERVRYGLKRLESSDPYVDRGAVVDDLERDIRSSLREGWQRPLTAEELRHRAVCCPTRDPRETVARLQTQVEDMQRFIEFLKENSTSPKNISRVVGDGDSGDKRRPSPGGDQLRAETVNLMKKVVALLQMFAVAQFGCSTDRIRKEAPESARPGNHWGDLRARLEMSIDAVCSLVRRGSSENESDRALGDYDSDSEDNTVLLQNVPLAIAVRKHLAVNVRDLMQHGLRHADETSGIVPFVGCFPMRRSSSSRGMHAWELIMRYYEVSNGDRYNSTPARRLSQSFNLDMVGNAAVSNRESMLSAVGAILASHGPYKRSHDSHFKAFVCAGLNANKLVAWLNVLFKNKGLMKTHYSPTSYVANTGFQDSLQSLDRLTPFKFDLPVDLAVRHFQNIKDVFM